eukprot:3197509-Rhodomonas_salina.1
MQLLPRKKKKKPCKTHLHRAVIGSRVRSRGLECWETDSDSAVRSFLGLGARLRQRAPQSLDLILKLHVTKHHDKISQPSGAVATTAARSSSESTHRGLRRASELRQSSSRPCKTEADSLRLEALTRTP